MSDVRHAILVLGCPSRPDGRPSAALERRLQRALQEATADPEAPLILSGGPAFGPVEAEVMRDWLQARGIAADRLWLEPRSRMTVENAWFSLALLPPTAERLTLVSDPFHLRRASWIVRLVLRRAGRDRVVLRRAPAEHAPGRRRRLVTALSEAVKMSWSLPMALFWRRD